MRRIEPWLTANRPGLTKLLVLVAALGAKPARAEEPSAASSESHVAVPARSPVEWRPEWKRYGTVDAVLTTAGLGAAVTALVIGPNTKSPLTTQLGIDEAIRDKLRPPSFFAQQAARDTSDELFAVNMSYPLVVDALVVADWHRNSPQVARQLALIDVEAFALTFGVQEMTANLVSRERPHGRTCGTAELSAHNSACALNDRYRGYFSGHTSLSFTAAALTCTHHRHLALYGGKAEWVPCVALTGSATATGVLRIVGDRHYFTDVVTAAAVGSFVGWVVPYAHYRSGRRAQRRRSSVSWTLVPMADGAAVMGSF